MTTKKIASGQYQVGSLRIENWTDSYHRCWVVLAANENQPIASTYTKREAVRFAYRHSEHQP
jgi:hypothetical protein